MSYFYHHENQSRSEDFGAVDPWEALKQASGFLTQPTPAPETFVAPQTPLVIAPGAFVPQPDEKISKYYKLKDLTKTSLPYPNLPENEEELENLRKMGTLLDAIRDQVGSFNIASVYRSQANQDYLRKSSSMAVAKSLHSRGMAADITPTNGMTTRQFAQAIYNNELLKVMVGQLVDKAEGHQTSVHISLPTASFPSATPMYVGAAGAYYRYRGRDLEEWQASSLAEIIPTNEESDLVSDEEMEDDSSSKPWGLILGGTAVVGLVLWAYMRKK